MFQRSPQKSLSRQHRSPIEALVHFYASNEPAMVFSYLSELAELEEFLKENNITRSNYITHYFVHCEDNPRKFEPIEKAFLASREKIKTALDNKQKVFIHCQQGLIRSPAITALLLKIEFGLEYKKIFERFGLGTFLSKNRENIKNYSLPENFNAEDLPKLHLLFEEKIHVDSKHSESEHHSSITVEQSTLQNGNDESENKTEQDDSDKLLARNILIICLCVPISWIPLALFWLVNTIKYNDPKAPAKVWEKTIDNIFNRKWSKSPAVSHNHENKQDKEPNQTLPEKP